MRPPSRMLRFVRLFIAALHIAVMGAAEIAEARFLQEDPLVVHIESESFDCPVQVHSDHCAICQGLLAAPDVDRVASYLPFAIFRSAPAALDYQTPLPGHTPSNEGLPRAPPALLT